MEETEKTVECTCNFPSVRHRNGSGHAPTCPVQLAWLANVKRQRTSPSLEFLHDLLPEGNSSEKQKEAEAEADF